ncbi:Uu.00g124880.m01.CDS01 [Anthostomella pinea]|uniref:Uu.00g124880.m01.CDS01 n=1 Tax=Anthostomella pinea TaxID=933095 RepID=A0AAI8VIQ0_9PEZI|nr:Uu.00g124880.m01.CDS01 [Anthostomella pinea]
MALREGHGLIWVVLIAALVTYRFLLRTPSVKRNGLALRQPPNTLPLVGNGILFLQARQKLFSWFVKCERQFGYETFQITVPTLHPGVVINDPKNLEYVFKHEGVFAKGDFFKRRAWDVFGNGIINADGELWRVMRKAGLHFLNTSNMRVLTDVALPRYLGQSVDRLKMRAGDGSVVDLQTVFHEITSQLMGKMAYDMEMHADDDFTLAFDYASGVTAERFQNPLWFITEQFTGSRFRSSLAIIRSFGDRIVESAVSHSRPNGTTDSKDTTDQSCLDTESGSLIQSLLSTLGSQKMVADAALNYLSAGRDTVAQALTWSMYLLIENESAAENVIQEVKGVVDASGESPEDLGRYGESVHSTMFTPASLPYTMAVFYEALRLYPPIPFEIRQCEEATTLPDGTFLPHKSVVLWCTWAMNRSRITWGDDADSFRPERWLTADGKLLPKSASEYPVFNGGTRTCLGKRMAELMAVQVIATMSLMFDFVPAYQTERVSKSSLTLPMEDGLPCYVKARAHTPDTDSTLES